MLPGWQQQEAKRQRYSVDGKYSFFMHRIVIERSDLMRTSSWGGSSGSRSS